MASCEEDCISGSLLHGSKTEKSGVDCVRVERHRSLYVGLCTAVENGSLNVGGVGWYAAPANCVGGVGWYAAPANCVVLGGI
jgi:hypothetical protein